MAQVASRFLERPHVGLLDDHETLVAVGGGGREGVVEPAQIGCRAQVTFRLACSLVLERSPRVGVVVRTARDVQSHEHDALVLEHHILYVLLVFRVLAVVVRGL